MRWILLAMLCVVSASADAEETKLDRSAMGLSAKEKTEGFVPLFDGKTLDGWVGLKGSTDSYYVKDGLLICKEDGKEHPGLKYTQGRIGLHAHAHGNGEEVFFRNIRIKELGGGR